MPPPLTGFDFYEKSLKSAKYVVAPMVEASELAWRMLGRNYGAQLCYTPMWHAGVFIRDERYRREALQSCPEDRPLIVQFCANDPETFRKAVEYTVNMVECDAIDLNLGCPQVIAKRGHFGAFLSDDWDLIHKLVKTIHDNFDIPITCKIRVFEDLQKTIDYAKMIESAGCQLLTVHGRTKEQKGALTGMASWEHIAAVKKALKIPVFANGNIQYRSDADRCMAETGVDGIMSAEGHLTNPALFAGINPPVWQMAEEYLTLVDQYPCPMSYVRGHMFKMLHHLLRIKDNFDVREIVAKSSTLVDFRRAVQTLKDRYIEYHEGKKEWGEVPEEIKTFKLSFPPWICQPYVRPPPEEHLRKLGEIQQREKEKAKAEANKRKSDEEDSDGLSKKKLKKLAKNPNKSFPHSRENCKICKTCPNPAGTKCDYQLCKKCCRPKCYREELDCSGHRILVKTKRQRAREYYGSKESTSEAEGGAVCE